MNSSGANRVDIETAPLPAGTAGEQATTASVDAPDDTSYDGQEMKLAREKERREAAERQRQQEIGGRAICHCDYSVERDPPFDITDGHH